MFKLLIVFSVVIVVCVGQEPPVYAPKHTGPDQVWVPKSNRGILKPNINQVDGFDGKSLEEIRNKRSLVFGDYNPNVLETISVNSGGYLYHPNYDKYADDRNVYPNRMSRTLVHSRNGYGAYQVPYPYTAA